MRELGREAAGQLPRLARLEQVRRAPGSRSGCWWRSAARQRPDEVLFLFGDRAHTAGEVNERIDNVVRGLIPIGVRQGEHVGVLMGSRPSALALVAALSRLGAVAVMLRPTATPQREAALGAGAADHRRPRARRAGGRRAHRPHLRARRRRRARAGSWVCR